MFSQPSSPELNISFESHNCDLAEILGNTYMLRWNKAYKKCFQQQKKVLKQQFNQFKTDVHFAEKTYKKFLKSQTDLSQADKEGKMFPLIQSLVFIHNSQKGLVDLVKRHSI